MRQLSDPPPEQKVILGVVLVFLPIWAAFVVGAATLWYGKPILSPENLTYDILMKIEWLITYQFNSCRVPFQSRNCFLRDFVFFGQIRQILWSGEPLCGMETPYWALKTLPMIIIWKWSGGSPMRQLLDLLLEQRVLFWVILVFFGQFMPLRPKTPAYDHLMKIRWLITNVTALRSPVRVESGFWVILDISGQFRPMFWDCLMKLGGWLPMQYSCRVALLSRNWCFLSIFDVFWPSLAAFVVGGATLWYRSLPTLGS